MKIKNRNFVLNLFFLSLLCGCQYKDNHTYNSVNMVSYKKPLAVVEKAWTARHQYDHERRLLIPMIGGTRWGSIQEYKENGTLEYKDWWIRDIKIEDLESNPSTGSLTSEQKPNTVDSTLEVAPLQIPSEENSFNTDEPSVEIDNGALLGNDSEETPFDLPPPENATILPIEDGTMDESPFAPLPDSLPPLDL